MKDKRLSGAEKDKERIRRKRRKERAERKNESDKEVFGGSMVACLKRKYAEAGEERDDRKRTEESKEEGEKSKELKRK